MAEKSHSAQDSSGTARLKFQPNRRAFIAMRIWATLLGFAAFTAAVLIAAYVVDTRIAWTMLLFVGLAVYDIADAFTSFKKQRYEFGRRQVYFGDGNLFTDRNTELTYANVTHVSVIKPFIEYRLFGTGKILIESAGSKGPAVIVRSVDKPYEAFEQIRSLLAEETFSLTYSQLLSEKKPSPLAVMIQIIGTVLAAIGFAIFSIGVTTIASIVSDVPFILLMTLLPLAAVFGLIYLFAAYQDQLRRTYYVYGDVIHYSEGFLTRREAFIPAGNLANTRLTQSFIAKLLNLQDVVVSCQGQGSEISFANLRGGEAMQKAVNNLINRRESLKSDEKEKTPEVSAAAPKSAEQIKATFTAASTPKGEDAEAQDFSMNMKRAMAPVLPLVVFPPALALALIAQYIVAKRTVYRLTDGGVASYYTFLSTKNVEFSRDKITGLVISRNPFDRYFGTCTVSFWSIGSGAAVDFRHIPYDENLEKLMRAKAGIIEDEELETIRPEFSLLEFYKANLAEAAFFDILFTASVIAGFIWSPWFFLASAVLLVISIIVWIILYRRYRRASLRFGQHTTSVKIGVLFRKHFYARHDNIKDITLCKYPSSSLGTIQFNVAGERTVDNGQGSKTSLPNRFSIAYIPHIASDTQGKSNWLDQVLLHKPGKQCYAEITGANAAVPKVQKLSRPSLKNSLAIIIPPHIIIFPLIIILPFTILLRRFWLRRVHYIIEGDRIVKRSGVVYRKQTSILFTRLDYIKTGQDFLNKVFKNGNLYLYTSGSSKAELTLRNIPDHKSFYQELERYYQK